MGLVEILIIISLLVTLQVLPYIIYYVCMKRAADRPWNVRVDSNYRPRVSIIVPTYQEAGAIETKMQNLNSINYPEDRLEIIVIDSASTDGTLETCKRWLAQNSFKFKIILLSEQVRSSKAHALNLALKHANGEIIVTTDADSILDPDILLNAIPYLADPGVGAVSGKENVLNTDKCFLARMENTYRDAYYTLRLGESKIHSAQIFQGEFAAYKRDVLGYFIETPGRSDDNSAVTEILRKGMRCLFIPEARFYDAMPCSLRDYFKIKTRRASQLQRELFIRLRLWIKGELNIPGSMLLANFYQHCISPLIFISSIPLFIFLVFWLSMTLPIVIPLLIFVSLLALVTARDLIALFVISNIILATSLIKNLVSNEPPGWEAIRSSREYLKASKLDSHRSR